MKPVQQSGPDEHAAGMVDLSRFKTHTDRSCAAKSLDEFIRDVSKVLQRSYPRNREYTASYDKAHILFLSWEDDDLNTESEIQDLLPLMKRLRFTKEAASTTYEHYKIPSDHPGSNLEKVLIRCRNKSALRPRELLVVYYGGRGKLDDHQRSIWFPRRTPRPEDDPNGHVDWTKLQGSLQDAEGDIVFILDCPYACSAVRGSRSAWKGFKELLAASGVHDEGAAATNNSFTKALIRELKEMRGKGGTISGLHASLIQNQEALALKNTPLRVSLSDKADCKKSLWLVHSDSLNRAGYFRAGYFTNQDSCALDFKTRVLMSINLRDPANYLKGIKGLPELWEHAPPDVLSMDPSPSLVGLSYVRSEAAFSPGLVLFSMPIIVWNMLSNDPSYRFIDLVGSANLISRGNLLV